MKIDAQHLAANWKTTAQGALSAVIGLSLSSAFMGALSPSLAGHVTVAASVAKVILGIMQQDAGTTVARLRTGEVAAVPSHELPDDASIKTVVK